MYASLNMWRHTMNKIEKFSCTIVYTHFHTTGTMNKNFHTSIDRYECLAPERRYQGRTLAFKYLPTTKSITAGGITKIPTSQSATARLITKQLVTVRNRRVVATDRMTKVLPITVMTISVQNSTTSSIFSHDRQILVQSSSSSRSRSLAVSCVKDCDELLGESTTIRSLKLNRSPLTI